MNKHCEYGCEKTAEWQLYIPAAVAVTYLCTKCAEEYINRWMRPDGDEERLARKIAAISITRMEH